MPTAALTLAVLLHAVVALGLWWLSPFQPVRSKEEPVMVLFDSSPSNVGLQTPERVGPPPGLPRQARSPRPSHNATTSSSRRLPRPHDRLRRPSQSRRCRSSSSPCRRRPSRRRLPPRATFPSQHRPVLPARCSARSPCRRGRGRRPSSGRRPTRPLPCPRPCPDRSPPTCWPARGASATTTCRECSGISSRIAPAHTMRAPPTSKAAAW